MREMMVRLFARAKILPDEMGKRKIVLGISAL